MVKMSLAENSRQGARYNILGTDFIPLPHHWLGDFSLQTNK
jgi:hypothetical protein